jgi:hypothetical protein
MGVDRKRIWLRWSFASLGFASAACSIAAASTGSQAPVPAEAQVTYASTFDPRHRRGYLETLEVYSSGEVTLRHVRRVLTPDARGRFYRVACISRSRGKSHVAHCSGRAPRRRITKCRSLDSGQSDAAGVHARFPRDLRTTRICRAHRSARARGARSTRGPSRPSTPPPSI